MIAPKERIVSQAKKLIHKEKNPLCNILPDDFIWNLF